VQSVGYRVLEHDGNRLGEFELGPPAKRNVGVEGEFGSPQLLRGGESKDEALLLLLALVGRAGEEGQGGGLVCPRLLVRLEPVVGRRILLPDLAVIHYCVR
jgi:hypothetical protein